MCKNCAALTLLDIKNTSFFLNYYILTIIFLLTIKGKDIRESNTSEPSKTVAIRKGAEVDKFGFYHAAQPTTSNPSSMSHDGIDTNLVP